MKKTIYKLIEWQPEIDGMIFDFREFKIDSIKNSIIYKAGDLINEKHVKILISKGYEIIIRQPKKSDFK